VARRYVEEHARKRNKSWRQADALVAKYLLRGWAKLDIGSIRRADVKAAIAAIAAPVTPAWRRAAVTCGRALN
jgi:hypothetical protein